MSDGGEIAVAGATGFTGSLVARALARRGCAVRLIGRDPARVASIAGMVRGASSRTVQRWDRDGIARALEGCAAVVSCAGPFVRAGWPVVTAAVRARVPYCDSTGEQSFIRRIYDELDQPARKAGVALLPGGGYDYVPGDLGSALAAEGLGRLDSIEACYAVEHGAMSTGTRRTMIETLRHTPMERVNGELRRTRLAALQRRVDTPFGQLNCVSIPGGEALMVPRHLDVPLVRTFAAAGDVTSKPALIAAIVAAARIEPIRRLIEFVFARMGSRPDDGRRSRFVCLVRARAADGRARTVELHAVDPYDFTARSLAEIAIRLAQRPGAEGALAPAQLLEPREFLSTLGVDVRIEDLELPLP